ncbi:MAG: 4-hydroxy-tetrahydrodipicolinate synthase [Bacillota bacterium]|nr:4-hydroxy-tetrahydrodipicolinate synthase [Bacillota bacterium]
MITDTTTRTPIRGSIVALITPFNEDGSVNLNKLGELLDFHLANRTDAILVLGTTGESATMTHEEDDLIVEYTLDRVGGRIPIIAGSGSNCTETQVDKSVKYADMGVDAVLCIAPYYVKANAEGMYRHFADVADVTRCPVILYNVPGRTGCSIPVETVARLAQHPNVSGLKEASGDMSYVVKVSRYISDSFALYSGNDDITVPLLSMGGSGTISVWANIMPETCHNMVMDYLEGRRDQAAATQKRYLDLINALFMEVNPIPVKEALNLMGMDVKGYRLPLAPMDPANRARLAAVMREAGLSVTE